VELLKEHGPSLKRPLVGEITTSKIKNMKELRPGSAGRSVQSYAEHIEAMNIRGDGGR
jgi:hypothetical protein